MDKVFKTVLVVVVAVLVGFGLVVNLKSIKDSQSRIESKLQGGGSDSNMTSQVNLLSSRLSQAEARINALEGKLNSIGAIAGAQGQRPTQRDTPPEPDLNKVY